MIKKMHDECYILMGQSPKSASYNNEKKGIPFLQGRKNFNRVYATIDTWTTEPTKIADKYSILLSVRAPVGDINIAPCELCIGRGLASIKMKNKNNKYLYYLLGVNKSKILGKSTGTVFDSINRSDLENLELNFHSFEEQEKIVDILSPIDEKIELNNKINKTLEDIAQLLYKQWFIDFEFPDEEGKPYKSSGGKMIYNEKLEKYIPEGWKLSEIKKFGKVITGKTPSTKILENFGNDYQFITIPDMNEMFVINTQRLLSIKGNNTQPNKLIPKNSICISCIATIGKVSISAVDSHTNQQINSIILNNEKYLEYIYYAMSNMVEYLKLLGSGATTTSNINKDVFQNIKILSPQEKTVNLFNEKINSDFQKIKNNLLENKILKDQKDIILEKFFENTN